MYWLGILGGQAGKFLKILSEVDLTKPLIRGTMLKYNNKECWIQFKYENLPTFVTTVGALVILNNCV